MTSRILPPEEWHRLAGTDAGTLAPDLDPDNAQVLVVEDVDAIVATWVLMRVVHAECVWIRPSHRARYSVVARLLRGMWDIAAHWGARRVVTGSVSEEVTDLITRLGGVPMPCASFALPVRVPTADQRLGQFFHEQLEAQVAEDVPHPHDATHDSQVGRALRMAIDGQAPERAIAQYNAWARTAGYADIRYLGTVDGRVRADIVTAVIDVDRDYTVRVVQEQVNACH